MSDQNPDNAEDLESPFLEGEVLAGEPRDELDPRLAALVQQSPFALATRARYFAPGGRATPGGAGGATPLLPPLGIADYWPDRVYIVKERDSFLNSARAFHTSWGFTPVDFESLEGLIGLVAKAKIPDRRIRVISHAWDGFKIPLFEKSPPVFSIDQKQIEALTAGDGALMDELLGKLVDLDGTTDKGAVLWNALLVHLESSSPKVLEPFGLTSKTRPAGDLDLLLRRCADVIAVVSKDSNDKVFATAVRKSITGAQHRLNRSTADVKALENAVRASGFTFIMSQPAPRTVDALRAAVGAVDKRKFRATLKQAQANLNGKWLDFRGCRIGHRPTYLEAFATLMGAAGCTAPDWWSGYPGEAPIGHRQVSNAAEFEKIANSSAAVEAAMNLWGAREFNGWGTVAAAARPARFFSDFLDKQQGVLPVYEVDYSGASPKQKHTLYWYSAVGKQRWLESMCDPPAKKRAQKIAGAWKANAPTPRMPTLALHLKLQTSSAQVPQKIHVVPEPGFRDHIIEVKKP